MVPVKEAINTGAWLHCQYSYKDGETYQFRLKVLSFRRLNLSEVDNPEKVKRIDESSTIWLLGIEVINLTKEPLSPTFGPNMLTLVDQDGFEFHDFDDTHLRFNSQFSKKHLLNRFFAERLIPKIKALGTIAFILPDDNEAVYSISIQYNGTVKEV